MSKPAVPMRRNAVRTWIAAGLLFLAAASAHASGGLSCEASDKAIKLTVEAGVSRGTGSGFFSFKGELDILAPGAPRDFRKLELGKEHLTQHWLDNRNLKLRIYREREGEPHGSVDIVIEAWPKKDAEDLEFRGGYTLTIFDVPKGGSDGKTTVLKGRVTCFSE
jgi:hypothetical protein